MNRFFALFLLCTLLCSPVVAESKDADNNDGIVAYGVNVSGGYDYDGYVFGLGGVMRIGRPDNRFNLLLGAKYQYVSPYLEHQLLVPVAVNWNFARLNKISLYAGVGCDVCIISSETIMEHWNFVTGDKELYPSYIGLSFGVAAKHFDWNISAKGNEDFRILETGFTYYF
jgi:hypothetical protein